ncbi:MAG: response regulator [bacterium]|nr:response regulator [bacterium]
MEPKGNPRLSGMPSGPGRSRPAGKIDANAAARPDRLAGRALVGPDDARRAHRMELLGQLAGGIAHDFNNFLTAIDGHLEMALDQTGLDPDLQRNLQIARQCSSRAEALTRRLLDFSRDRLSPPEPASLNEIVRDAAQFLGGFLSRDIDLRVDLRAAPDQVLVEKNQIEQALMNLAINAQAAMPEGGTIVIRTRNQIVDESFQRSCPWARPGFYVALDVEDAGVGISPEMQARIFEPYFTARADRSGTGLGLPIVYGIVKQHRGFIGVDSDPGNGSRFWILLPMGRPPVAAGRAVSDGSAAPRDETEGQGTVLLVEDEDVLRELVFTVLSERGWVVLPASSAEEAEAIFTARSGNVDLLLTDLMLSGSSGRRLAQELRTRKPELKIVYTSGYDSDSFPLDLSPEGGAVFLEKPYSLRGLSELVHRLVAG